MLRLAGHKKKVFNVAFSPLVPDWVASTSDDHTAIVHDLQKVSFGILGVPVLGRPIVEGGNKTVSYCRNVNLTGSIDNVPDVCPSTMAAHLLSHACLSTKLRKPSNLGTAARACCISRIFVFWQFSQVILSGHDDRVRALQWSHELANILHTGSWDRTIRMWDARCFFENVK